MKRISLAFIAIFIAIVAFGQNTPQANGELNQKKEDVSVEVSTRQFPPLVSIVTLRKPAFVNETYKYEGEHDMYNCESYRRMEIAGIVLSAVGGGLIITGSIIQASAYRASNEGTISNYDYYNRVNGGGAMVGLGVVGTGVGIPLAIIGSVHIHRWCYGRGYQESRGY